MAHLQQLQGLEVLIFQFRMALEKTRRAFLVWPTTWQPHWLCLLYPMVIVNLA